MEKLCDIRHYSNDHVGLSQFYLLWVISVIIKENHPYGQIKNKKILSWSKNKFLHAYVSVAK